MASRKYDTAVNRRLFLRTSSVCSAVYLFQPFALGSSERQETVRFGLIADVHQDVMHDGPQRVRAFAEGMNGDEADFVCQLGDFCQPHERNRDFLAHWEQFKGPRHHVLGNHDMDGGYTREQTVAFLGMPGTHYSFDKKGVHVMVLDGNDPGGKSKGYKRYVSAGQLNWITEDLKATSLPTVVFSHQALDDSSGIENCEDVRKALEDARTKKGQNKVAACFCGHHHEDRAKQINGIHYIRINSASYVWLGSEFKHESYDRDIHQRFPWISHTVPYKAPLWALVEMDVVRGRLIVSGRETDWVGPSPWEVGADKETKDPDVCAPRISDRVLLYPVPSK